MKANKQDYNSIWLNYGHEILSYFVARTRSYEESRDLAQDTFEIFLRMSREGTIDPETIRGLLYELAKGKLRNWLRGEGRGLTVIELDESTREVQDQSPNPESAFVDAELVAGLNACIEELPDKYRRVIQILLTEHLSTAQMGKRLGIPKRTAARLMDRAKHLYKQKLETAGVYP